MGKTLQNMITRSKQGLTKRYPNKRLTPNTYYAHLPADVQLAVPIAIGIAPAFTLLNGKVLQQSDKWTKALCLDLML